MNPASLRGKRIVITRAREQAESFAEKIRVCGGTPILFPTIAFAPLENFSALDDALNNLCAFDWAVFTSANGVRFAAERGDALGINLRVLNESRIAGIGTGTANALREKGVRVDFLPTRFTSEQLARELPLARGERVLLLRADIASNELAHALVARGARVFDVDAYRTIPAPRARIDFPRADAVTFTSPSTVENSCPFLKETNFAFHIFCIGPVTANAVRHVGMNVAAVAQEHTLDGLVSVICDFYERNESHAVSRNENINAI